MMGLFKKNKNESGKAENTKGGDKQRTSSVKQIFNHFVATRKQAQEAAQNGEYKAPEDDLKYQSCAMPINVLEINGANYETAPVKVEEKPTTPPAASPVVAKQTKRKSSPEGERTPQDVLSLDEKVIELIITFAGDSAKSLCTLALVNSLYAEIASQDKFWKPLFLVVAKSKGREESIVAEPFKVQYALLYKPSASPSPSPRPLSVSESPSEDGELPSVAPEVPMEQVLVLQQQEITATSPQPKTQKPKEKVDPIDPKPFYCADYTTIQYKEDPPENIVWSEEEGKKQIEYATLNKLLEELTSHTYYDNHFLHTFMLTFRSFTNKEELMSKLEERYNIPPPEGCTHEEFAVFKKEKLDRVRLRVCQTLKYWIEKFYQYDFDEELIKKIENFIEAMEKSNGTALATMLKRTVQNAKESASKGIVAAKLECPPIMNPKKSFSFKKKKYGIMDWPLLEVARQITLIDFNLFVKIEPKECLNQAWAKGQRETKAANICSMINWFNKLSNWVGTQIVLVEDVEKRAKMMTDFIQMGAHCKELNNFNGLFSIISGLALASIYRLKQTWGMLAPEVTAMHKELAEYISRDRNFRTIRTAIKSVKPPCIPYIGLYLTDLTFIEEGSPKYVDNKINFVKNRKFAEVIRDIQTYQNTRYALSEVPELKDMLLNVTILGEEEMYAESLKREGRAKRSVAAPSQ